MDRVFNRGIGMVLVVDAGGVDDALSALHAASHPGVVIGDVVSGSGVQFA